MSAHAGNSRHRILLVVSSYLPNVGGLQNVTCTLAGQLQKQGFEVTVLTQRYPRSLPASEVLNGVRVRRLLFLTPRWQYLGQRRLDLFLAALFYFPATLVSLLWQISREKPEVLNLHFVGAPALFVLLSSKIFKFRFVVSLHGDDVEGLARGGWFDRWVFRATVKQADYVTACSRYLLDEAIQIEPSISAKAQAIYNGAELPTAPTIAHVGDYVLALGRMVPKKGFDVLLRALPRILGAKCVNGLMLIGDGPERAALEALARELGIFGRVSFCGSLSRERVIEAMVSSRLVIIPSRQEPFGIVALEAMAAGKPVVATRAGGLPEVLEGADSAIVDPDDPVGLAEAVACISEQISREPTFGIRNRPLAARFSPERMVSEYLKVYD
jgi:glycogen(starch) synthase